MVENKNMGKEYEGKLKKIYKRMERKYDVKI